MDLSVIHVHVGVSVPNMFAVSLTAIKVWDSFRMNQYFPIESQCMFEGSNNFGKLVYTDFVFTSHPGNRRVAGGSLVVST
jgi:hypothetical protein